MARLPTPKRPPKPKRSEFYRQYAGRILRTTDGHAGHILVVDSDESPALSVMWETKPSRESLTPAEIERRGWRIQSLVDWSAERDPALGLQYPIAVHCGRDVVGVARNSCELDRLTDLALECGDPPPILPSASQTDPAENHSTRARPKR